MTDDVRFSVLRRKLLAGLGAAARAASICSEPSSTNSTIASTLKEGPNEYRGREKAPRGAARPAEQSRLQRHQGYFSRPHCASGRRVRALRQDQELPLAHIRPAFPGLSPPS